MMSALADNLARYLEAERLLNGFFAAFHYCVPACIAPRRQSNRERRVAACCTRRYYACDEVDHPAFALLRREREARYGRPQDHACADAVSVCEYHHAYRGCLLSTHKSPTCLSFLCPPAIECLRREFGIYAYDYLGVYHALEWILTGDMSHAQSAEFTKGIREMTRKVMHRPTLDAAKGAGHASPEP
jgi:hypothetical protein